MFVLQKKINLTPTEQNKLPATHNLLMTVLLYMAETYNHNKYLQKKKTKALITFVSETLFNINHLYRLRNVIRISQGVIQVD